jgi:hypothetical protein
MHHAMDVARWLGTNNYDVVCAISARAAPVAAGASAGFGL